MIGENRVELRIHHSAHIKGMHQEIALCSGSRHEDKEDKENGSFVHGGL
jgi:hypothetical protein